MHTRLAIAALLLSSSVSFAADPITDFPLPTPAHRPQAVTPGPDGNLWVTEVLKHEIVRITPDGTITEFVIPPADPAGKVGVIQGITAGSDGNLYFTSRAENAIRRITPKGEFTASFKIPTVAPKPDAYNNGGCWPREITTGPDGHLYFTEMAANKVGRVSTAGEFKEFTLPTADSKPYGLVTGPDKKIWFTESEACKIGRLDPASGKIDEFPLPTQKSLPRDMTVGPDGNIWFSENQADKVGRITPAGEITEFQLDKGSRPIGIAPGPDGNIYVACFGNAKLARLTPDGKPTYFDLPTPKAQPFCLALGPDKNIWIAQQANSITRVDVKALTPNR